MLAMLLTIIIAFVVSYVITQDGSLATIHLGASTLENIPLFFVVFASIIFGALLASLTTIKNLIQSKLTIFGQKSDLKKSYKTVDDLQAVVNKLEAENSVFKAQNKELARSAKNSDIK